MRSFIRVFIVLGIGFLLVYGLLKGITYYKVQDAISDLNSQLTGKAEVAYREIQSDLLKETIRVNGISVFPAGSNDAAEIDFVELRGLGPTYIVKELVNFAKSKPPEALQYLFSGIRLDLDGDIVKELSEQSGKKKVDACASDGEMNPALFKSLGMESLVLDLDGSYRLVENQGELDVDFGLEVRDIQSIEMGVSLADISVAALKAGAQMPSLAGFNFDIKMSPEFGRRFSTACAEKQGISVDAFKTSMIKRVNRQMLQSGFTPGRGIKQAINEFYRSWGSISLAARPLNPVGVMSLVFLPPEQLAQTLGLQLVVNDKLITDTSFTWDKDGQGSGLPEMLGMAPPKKKTGPPKKRYRKEYRNVAVNELQNHISKDVRLNIHDQPMREGILVSIIDGEAKVMQRVQGGKFTAHVPLSDIASAQVQFRILIKKK